MINRCKPLARYGLSRLWSGLGRLGLAPSGLSPVAYVVERGENWSIRWDGEYYARAVNVYRPGTLAVVDRPERLSGQIAHFGSQFVWQLWAKAIHPSNRQLVTFFHGKPEDGADMARHVDFFLDNLKRLERVVTAASLVEKRLLSWGVPASKLVRVPLGIDTSLFSPPTPEEKLAARRAFGIPENAVCIGSFQKDGMGWGEGNEPKLIKGPDLFVEAVSRLANQLPVFVLLTGPARGYVKSGLERHGIPYHHTFLQDYPSVAHAFRALDLYLMTSREEGGPKALLESLASGVPLVSARVGMADDLFPEANDPRAVEVGDVDAMVEKASRLIGDGSLTASLCASGRRLAEEYAWERVGRPLYDFAYKGLLTP